MEKIISFITENYEFLILIGACILDVVLFLFGVFRKRHDLTLDELMCYIPDLVSKAEKMFGFGNGEKKLDFVLTNLKEAYKLITGIELTDDSAVVDVFKYQIEKVLETPQKKGK